MCAADRREMVALQLDVARVEEALAADAAAAFVVVAAAAQDLQQLAAITSTVDEEQLQIERAIRAESHSGFLFVGLSSSSSPPRYFFVCLLTLSVNFMFNNDQGAD